MKQCPHCREVKPRTAFTPSRTSRSGLQSWCKVCVEQAAVKWRKRNPDRWRASQRERSRRFRERHRPTEATRLMKRRIEAKRRARTPVASLETKEFMDVLVKDVCAFCGSRESIQVDHIDALSLGGEHHWTNLSALCIRCNSGKRNKALLAAL